MTETQCGLLSEEARATCTRVALTDIAYTKSASSESMWVSRATFTYRHSGPQFRTMPNLKEELFSTQKQHSSWRNFIMCTRGVLNVL